VEKRYWVYMLASQRNGTLYIGSTSDLVKRVWEHRSKVVEGFTEHYGVDRLVWFEEQPDAYAMVTRERRLKKWNRDWKIRLIEEHNPHWDDLYPGIT
jgi:putative endonuclease